MNLTRLKTIAADLQKEIAAAEAARDPLAAHIYTSRARYRRTSESDNKGGKKTEREVWASFLTARALGYQGSAQEWWTVLRSG